MEQAVVPVGLPRDWYCVRVKPQHERTVSYALGKKGFERYVPFYRTLRRWAESMKELDAPLFPGYVFCRMNLSEAAEVVSTPAVYQLVAQGSEPGRVAEHELHMIQRIECAGLPLAPWPMLKDGQRVRIARGALTGVVGLLAGTPQAWHVVVNVPLLHRSVAVTVDRADIAPLSMAAAAGA